MLPEGGYRILEYDAKTQNYKTLFHGLNGSRIIPTGTWLTAQRKLVADGTSKRKYISGFHVLRWLPDCLKYARKFKLPRNRIIVEVWFKDYRRKRHSNSPVLLADKMYISKDARHWTLAGKFIPRRTK